MITIFFKNNLKINIENKITEVINTIGRKKKNCKDESKEYGTK